MKTSSIIGCGLGMLLVAEAFAATALPQLKEGVFNCEDKYYATVKLAVREYPGKPHKLIINWEGRDRVLHREDSMSGALRYEGAESQLVYIQTPHHSVLLNHRTMKPVLTECQRVK